MGNPKFPRKKYTTPLHPWKEDRIKTERELIKKYGLKNHKEVWKAKIYLGKHRQQARELLAKMNTKDPQVKKESDQLLLHLTRIGILPTGSSLDDVLALETETVLSRRLQTLVYLKGLSTTPDHSRQLINHGHIAVGGRKVTIPSYMVIKNEESDIGYTKVSPLNELSHPARPKADVIKSITTKAEDDKKPKDKKEPVKKAEVPTETKDEDLKEADDKIEDVSKSSEKPEVKAEIGKVEKDTKKPIESSKDTKQEQTNEPEETKEPSEKKEENVDDKKESKGESESKDEKPIDNEGGK